MALLFDYTVPDKAIYRSAAYKAVHRAVLWPLGLSGTGTKTSLQAAYANLVSRWRARVAGLGAAGWTAARASTEVVDADGTSQMKNAPRYTYLCNCPPCGVTIKSRRGFSCQHARICPHCYAREIVINAYASLAWALFMGQKKTMLPTFQLVGTRYTFHKLCDVVAGLHLLHKHRNTILQQLPRSLGNLSLLTLSPAFSTGSMKAVAGKLQLDWSTISILPGDAKLPDLKMPDIVKVRTLSYADLTRAELAKLVGWATEYPRGMMLGDAKQAAEICTVAKSRKARMFITTGILRNKGVRLRETNFRQAANEGEEPEFEIEE